jgi:hypothetical protein
MAAGPRSALRIAALTTLTALAVVGPALVAPPAQGSTANGGRPGAGHHGGWGSDPLFERVGTFPVYENLAGGEDPTTETSSEIVTATGDGRTLIYTDSPAERIGFVDITDPSRPQPDGFLALAGEPTSASVHGRWLLVAIDMSESFENPSGELVVYDTRNRSEVASFELPGQPDSIGTNPRSNYAAVTIENQRDEDVVINGVEGGLPQEPAGSLVRVRMKGRPSLWTTDTIELTGLSAVAPSDPEPEYVDVSDRGLAVVTLQENNHLVVVDLPRKRVIRDFPAGTTDLTQVDTVEDGVISPTDELADVVREPDAVAWVSSARFVTANEGDLFGGSRGFTQFDRWGNERYDSGNSFEHLAISLGHYPEGRSENKGTEPEGVEFGDYGRDGELLFVGAERANLVGVYQVRGRSIDPDPIQVLPTGVGPEGLLAVPRRNLLVVASEVDAADDGIRSILTIYQLSRRDTAPYPMLTSVPLDAGSAGAPIGWGALSGLAADPTDATLLYAIHDNAYDQPRIYTIDASSRPARIIDQLPIGLPDDLTLDAEGLTIAADGSFWVASEGSGEADGTTANRLVQVAPTTGAVMDVVDLPVEVAAQQTRFGLEGVSYHDDALHVVVQREWADDPEGTVKVGRFDLTDRTWSFARFPLDPVESPAGGWVGLSEIASLGDGSFAVVERDNQAGPDKAIARVVVIRPTAADWGPADAPGTLAVSEPLDVLDVLDGLSQSGWWGDKLEGLAVGADGTVWFVTDNDAVDDATGETLFGAFGTISDLPAPPAP